MSGRQTRYLGSLGLCALAAISGCTTSDHGPTVPPGSATPSHQATSLTPATISGRLQAVGGPCCEPARPLPGTITIGGGRLTTPIVAGVGADGYYSVHIPPGNYHLSGRSPQYNSGTVNCTGDRDVTVGSGDVVTVNVDCQEK